MNDVEAQILSYPHLSVEEQREIEAYVESHPEWASLLKDVRSLEGLSANQQSNLPDNALLATYVTFQHLHEDTDDMPSRLQAAFSTLESQTEEDEFLQREVEAARRRLKEAEASLDPVTHFETLTEHTLHSGPESEPADASEQQDARRSAPSLWATVLNLPRLVRRGAVLVVVLAVAYGGLYGVSRATQSTLDRLATMEVSSQVVENYADAELRSPMPASDTASVDEQYLDALSTLREARRSTLGLFPHYDAEKLAQSERGLKRVLKQVEPGSFLAREAHFFLGKIALAQEEVATARSHFKIVVKQEGRRAGEAYDILKTLQQAYGNG
jgi:anti-sigma-K factor RskA